MYEVVCIDEHRESFPDVDALANATEPLYLVRCLQVCNGAVLPGHDAADYLRMDPPTGPVTVWEWRRG